MGKGPWRGEGWEGGGEGVNQEPVGVDGGGQKGRKGGYEETYKP